MKSILYILLVCLPLFSQGQTKLFSRSARITFLSNAPLEDIESRNNQVVTVWDVATGTLEFSLLIRGFEFKKALMQQHFNENYLESDKYPKAIFKGTIQNAQVVHLKTDGNYAIDVAGDITIHGVTRKISIPATIVVKNRSISARAEFTLSPANFNIQIPAIVKDNISKQIKVQVFVPQYIPLQER